MSNKKHKHYLLNALQRNYPTHDPMKQPQNPRNWQFAGKTEQKGRVNVTVGSRGTTPILVTCRALNCNVLEVLHTNNPAQLRRVASREVSNVSNRTYYQQIEMVCQKRLNVDRISLMIFFVDVCSFIKMLKSQTRLTLFCFILLQVDVLFLGHVSKKLKAYLAVTQQFLKRLMKKTIRSYIFGKL